MALPITAASNKVGTADGQQFNAFSGADIVAYINHIKAGNLQAITCSITREVAPLYSFGDANPKTFVKGKRGIAGTLVFTQFDRHAILKGVFEGKAGKDPSKNSSNTSLFGTTLQGLKDFAGNQSITYQNGVPQQGFSTYDSATDQFIPTNPSFGGGSIDLTNNAVRQELQNTYDLVASRLLKFADQIPPFDVTITLVNEEGHAATATIYQVTLVNEGWGFTLDDLTSETAYTYVARGIQPLTPLSESPAGSR
jgi:hypothetical protein